MSAHTPCRKHEWGFNATYSVARPGRKYRTVAESKCRICGKTKRAYVYKEAK